MHEDRNVNASINDGEFTDKVLKNDKPVVVEFGAEWCGACHILAPVIKQLLTEFDKRIVYCKIDVDENMSTAKKYGIKDLPTLLFFKDGKVTDHTVGALQKKVLREIFNKLSN